LVLTYHRIGDPAQTMFDPGVYSATADEFHDQIAYLKKFATVVTLDEALAFVSGDDKSRKSRYRVLITFDDGCIDNYEVAFPILRSLGVQGLFFLITGMAGTNTVPWWDRIAYILRTGARNSFELHYPAGIAVDVRQLGFAAALRHVLQAYKRPDNQNGERFIAELAESCGGQEPPAASRVFLNWDEAREMIAGGMAIGSHTHTHTVLSQLTEEKQREELVRSRDILSQALQVQIDTIAYPVGSRIAFSEATQLLARQAGYRAAFSHYGGVNRAGPIAPFNVLREKVGSQSWKRFCAQAAICKRTGHFWP
jgi:peptidoglycan/xylan/chitin deacetylase (PgdA/CDA1 family)